MRLRKPLPKTIRDAPELLLGLEFAYAAYWDLSTCRDFGWGLGPIPWTTIKDYAESHELDDEDAADFVYLIRSMDKAHIEYNNEQNAKKAAEGAK